MAIQKFNFLDESGVQALSKYLLAATNTRIKERISTAITEDSFTDESHVLAAKVILGLIGNIDNYDTTIDGTGSTVLDKIKALKNAIGEDVENPAAGTVYAKIAAVKAELSGLTHLTYQVVTGNIEEQVPMADADEKVIYLQHDEPRLSVGNDGYLLNSEKEHASVGEGAAQYFAYYDAAQGKFFKATEADGVTTEELNSSDSIFTVAATVEDKTYNLYIAQLTKEEGVTTAVEWICVGDTSLELSNYWSKTDADVAALRDLMITPLTATTIEGKVQAAFAETDPYEGGAAAYVAW